MFTGIIEEMGTVLQIDNLNKAAKITINAENVLDGVKHGDSISVNGVCLTVTEFDSKSFSVDVMQESLDRSALGNLNSGSKVNLERAALINSRLGGHIVQGHVDAIAKVSAINKEENWTVVRFIPETSLLKYIVEKGSITVNGVSLTVSGVGQDWFEVSLIPTTLEVTNLGKLNIDEIVNIEVDIIAKYIEKIGGFNG